MKTVRAELSAEGRMDILDRVMSYRGGYSREVFQTIFSIFKPDHPFFRIVGGLSEKRLRGICLVLLPRMLWNWELILEH